MCCIVEVDVARGDCISPPRTLLLLQVLLGSLDLRLQLGLERFRFPKGFLCFPLMHAGLLVLLVGSDLVL